MSDAPKQSGFPETPDQLRMTEMVRAIADSIDREKADGEKWLRIFHHPLIKEQLTPDVALDQELFTLIDHVIHGAAQIGVVADDQTIREQELYAEKNLIMLKKEDIYLMEKLQELREIVKEVRDSEEGSIKGAIAMGETSLREVLTLPTEIQSHLLVNPVNQDVIGRPKQEIIGVIASIKQQLEAVTRELADREERITQLSRIEEVSKVVRGWFETEFGIEVLRRNSEERDDHEVLHYVAREAITAVALRRKLDERDEKILGFARAVGRREARVANQAKTLEPALARKQEAGRGSGGRRPGPTDTSRGGRS